VFAGLLDDLPDDERPQKREYSMLLPVDSTRKTARNPSGLRAECLTKQTA
jgi:hypothetical protein